VERDLDDGYLNSNIFHLVLDAAGEPESVEIVSILSDGVVGELGFGPVIRLARVLQPIAAISVIAIYVEDELSGAFLLLQEANYAVIQYRLERCKGVWRLREAGRRDIRDGIDLPFIPEHYDALVADGVWTDCFEDAARDRTRGSTIH
jgi:hypothetical protein